jgi:hypothetical protein
MDPYINRFFSEKWIQREVLKFTDDQAAQIKDDFSESEMPGGISAVVKTTESNPFGGGEETPRTSV